MKRIIYLIAFSLITLTSMAKVPDFSGTWDINKEKSTLNEQFSMAPNQLILVQSAETLDVEKHATWQDQEFTMNDKFTLDGKECVNPGWQDSQKTSTAAWSADGNTLTITSKLPMQDGTEMTIIENYQLEGDNLKLNVSASSSFGEMAETFIFNRKQ